MNLKEIANRLRKAADVLDELVGLNLNKPTKHETKAIAEKIVKKAKKKKLHWTQRPENKKRVLAQLKNAVKAKQSK